MFTATHTVTITRGAQEVFDYVADAGFQRSWNELVRSMDPESEGPLRVGARWRGDVARVGKMDVELVEYEPPRRAKHIARPWMAEAHHVWEVDELPEGCRLTQHGDMRPKGAGWLLAPLMPLIVRRQLRDCATSLKRALEAQPATAAISAAAATAKAAITGSTSPHSRPPSPSALSASPS